MARSLPLPCLALVTDRKQCGLTLEEAVRLAVEGGVNVVQLREKDLTPDELRPIARRLRALTEGKALLVVNSQLSLALDVGADGAHLPEAAPAKEVRSAGEAGLLVGRSVHSVEAALKAQLEGADYLQVGTIYASSSKPGVTPSGPDLLASIEDVVSLPLIAIGGISKDRVAEVMQAGASGVAVISAILGAADSRAAARGLREALDEACQVRTAGDGRMICLTVNGKRREMEGSLGLMQFLEQNSIQTKFIAVAHNGVVLRREEYEAVVLRDGDSLEIVHMVGGG